MSRGLNKVMLIGNLGSDPEIRSTANGTSVGNFSLATNETFQNAKGEKVEKVQWHRIVVWKGLADIAKKYLNKGSKVFIEGQIEYGSYEDKEGVTRYTCEIVARELTMLDAAPARETVPA